MTSVLANEELITEILNRLINGLNPDRIYLFGSQANKKATQFSDIDILVVVSESDQPRHQRESHSYDLLWGITRPIDVIVMTSKEFDQSAQVKTSLAARTLTTGKLLYGKPKNQ